MTWHTSQEPGAKASDGTWGCPNAAQPYPAMHHSLVHPCTSPTLGCCGLPQASFNLRFHSFLAAPKAMLLMAYEVHFLLSRLPNTRFKARIDADYCSPCCSRPPLRIRLQTFNLSSLPGRISLEAADGMHSNPTLAPVTALCSATV